MGGWGLGWMDGRCEGLRGKGGGDGVVEVGGSSFGFSGAESSLLAMVGRRTDSPPRLRRFDRFDRDRGALVSSFLPSGRAPVVCAVSILDVDRGLWSCAFQSGDVVARFAFMKLVGRGGE